MSAARPRDGRNGLRDALIEAGIALLEDGGIGGLTLRRAAARAGVSHAAPAYHFDGLQGLKNAIARRGFELFLAQLAQVLERPAPQPFARLLACNLAYIGFADAHPGLFHVMFEEADHGRDAGLRQVAQECHDVLQMICAPFSDGDTALAPAVWALTHGFAVLHLGQARPDRPLPAQDYERHLRLLLADRIDAAGH